MTRCISCIVFIFRPNYVLYTVKIPAIQALVALLLCSCLAVGCKNGLRGRNNNTNNPNKADSSGNNPYLLTSLDTAQWAKLLQPDAFSQLVEIETSVGVLRAELFFHTPVHRENFLKLVSENFYSGILFHRVIKGFMAQTGDPTSKNARKGAVLGMGGTGYELEAEINTQYFHVRGAIAAARTSDEANPEKKSSGSQFYIVDGRRVTNAQLEQIERKYNFSYTPQQRLLYQQLGGAPQLDMEYTVFGRVYEGLELIDSITQAPADKYDRPTKDIKILRVKQIK